MFSFQHASLSSSTLNSILNANNSSFIHHRGSFNLPAEPFLHSKTLEAFMMKVCHSHFWLLCSLQLLSSCYQLFFQVWCCFTLFTHSWGSQGCSFGFSFRFLHPPLLGGCWGRFLVSCECTARTIHEEYIDCIYKLCLCWRSRRRSGVRHSCSCFRSWSPNSLFGWTQGDDNGCSFDCSCSSCHFVWWNFGHVNTSQNASLP